MTETTALVKPEVKQRPLIEIVREGASLALDDWGDARIAAVRSMLPPDFRDPDSMIAFLARAQSSGLNPILNELWAWKDPKRSKLVFMTSRDGWLKLAREDANIESVEFGHVYDGDEFRHEREAGRVMITHSGGVKKNVRAVAAYAVVHYTNSTSGNIEIRTFQDYEHLLSKDNWRVDPNGMLLTRTVVAAIKFASPKAAGLVSDAHMHDEWAGSGEASAGVLAGAATETSAEALRERLQVQQGQEPQDAAFVAPAKPEAPAEHGELGGDPTSPIPYSAPATAPNQMVPCRFCEKEFANQRGVAGHGRSHQKEKALEKKLKEAGIQIQRYFDNEQVMFAGYEGGILLDKVVGITSWLECYAQAIGARDEASENPPESPVAEIEQVQIAAGFMAVPDTEKEGSWLVMEESTGELVSEGMPLSDIAAATAWLELYLSQEDNRDAEHAVYGKGIAEPEEEGPPDGSEHEPAAADPTEEQAVPEVKVSDLYRICEEKGLDDSLLQELINSSRWDGVFGKYRREGSASINVFDLQAGGKTALKSIIEEIETS